MTKSELAVKSVAALKSTYPDALCSLEYRNPLELLIATRLSAQCTDARVNLVTPALFNKYPTLDDYCNAKVEDVDHLLTRAASPTAASQKMLSGQRRL